MRIAVQHERVAEMVALMANTGKNIATILENLDRESKLLQSDWTGEARDAYRVAHAQWSAALQEMNDIVLRELARTLVNANQHSIDASTSATRVWE
ncbi:WXG100 family type VII secretion target [Microbacterium sp.]|uniref:WXG100 family type VII secretion target n=1 Tax=Microbacterium sp. TaxID=51671 RepID=UPI0039E61707